MAQKYKGVLLDVDAFRNQRCKSTWWCCLPGKRCRDSCLEEERVRIGKEKRTTIITLVVEAAHDPDDAVGEETRADGGGGQQEEHEEALHGAWRGRR